MVIYDNEFETKGNRNEIQPRITLKHKLAATSYFGSRTTWKNLPSSRVVDPECRSLQGGGARGGDSPQLMPIEITMPNNEKYCN